MFQYPKATPATAATISDTPDGGTYQVIPDGILTLAGSEFNVERTIYTNEAGDQHKETHLIGKRGATYLLRPYIESKGDSGIRQVISMNGSPMRKHGNIIQVIEIAGIIEEYKK